jgi:hypothetical protein
VELKNQHIVGDLQIRPKRDILGQAGFGIRTDPSPNCPA